MRASIRQRSTRWASLAGAACLLALTAGAQVQVGQTAATSAPQSDTSYIDAAGTAHVTRVVPVPKTVSDEAQSWLAKQAADDATPETLESRRTGTDRWQTRAGEHARTLYPVNITSGSIAGVPVRLVMPLTVSPANRDRVLINVHGGGFNSDSGSITESVPIANLTGIEVVAVLYPLAPEHPFPAALDGTIAVYRELLKTHKPEKIGLYGTSAGAILTAEVAVKLKQMHLPLPGALGIFSGIGDFSRPGDSIAMYALNGLSGHLEPPGAAKSPNEYYGEMDPRDPVLSPVFADLHGMPPTLFVTSGRDLLLSGTTILHRAFLRSGADARLVVFEGLPHAFWNNADLPESKEACAIMAKFFSETIGGAGSR
ncbi:MAG TPA: alpha/beta hydrolase fold domain-containing protein [Acidisarcina sp.]